MDSFESELLNTVKTIVAGFSRKYAKVHSFKLQHFVIIDTSWKSPNLAHFIGYIAKDDGLLIAYLQIDRDRANMLSDGLKEFLVAHELCHSLCHQLSGDNAYRFSSLVAFCKRKGIDNVLLTGHPEQFTDFLKKLKLACSNGLCVEHKCVDRWARDLLNYAEKDFSKLMEELYCHSGKDSDMTKRLYSAKHMHYKDCCSFG